MTYNSIPGYGIPGYPGRQAAQPCDDRPAAVAAERRADGYRRSAGDDPIRIGLLLPLGGPAGLWAPSCECSAKLAAQEINQAGGINGRPVELVLGDGSGTPAEVAVQAKKLVGGGIDAVVGMHLSDVRAAAAAVLVGHGIPYVYTPLYEGGERTPGVFALGETPRQQLGPAMTWLGERRRVERWVLLGNDYVWPRLTHRAARRCVRDSGGTVAGEVYVALGCTDWEPTLAQIRAARPDAVLISLIGGDAVAFNRVFVQSGLAGQVLRLSTVVEENTLYGIGAECTENLYSVLGYLSSLQTPENATFMDSYYGAFGDSAPVPNTHGQSCYEGVHFYASLATEAGSFRLDDLIARAAAGISYRSVRGAGMIHRYGGRRPMYIAAADGLDLRPLLI